MVEHAFLGVVDATNVGWGHKGPVKPTVSVLGGSVAEGDEVEVLQMLPDGSDGTVTRAHVLSLVPIRPGDEKVELDLTKQDIDIGSLIRTPNGRGPLFDLADGATGARLEVADAVRRCRTSGFSVPRHTPGSLPYELAASVVDPAFLTNLARLTDEAIVLLVEKRLRDALRPGQKIFDLKHSLERAAALYDVIGLDEHADRLRLVEAAALEGGRVGVLGRALAAAVATGALAATESAKHAAKAGMPVGLALGIEMGEGFAIGYQRGLAIQGEAIRQPLQESGRAVGVGWCKKCRDVVTLDKRLRCTRNGKRVEDPLVVVPSDLQDAREMVRAKHV